MHGASTVIVNGDVGPDFNRLLVRGPAPPAQVFPLADPFFGDPSRYRIVVETKTAPAVEEGLRARGSQLDEEEPTLVPSPLPSALSPALAKLAIRPVVDTAGFAAWWIIGLTVSALVVLFVLRWFHVVTKSTKKLEEEYDYLIPRESSDKLQLRLQEAERELKRAQEVLRERPTPQSRSDYFAVLEEVNWLKKQLDEKE